MFRLRAACRTKRLLVRQSQRLSESIALTGRLALLVSRYSPERYPKETASARFIEAADRVNLAFRDKSAEQPQEGNPAPPFR